MALAEWTTRLIVILVLLGTTASDASQGSGGSAATINVTGVFPTRLPVEGITEVTVTVSPSAAGRAAAATGSGAASAGQQRGEQQQAFCRLVLYNGPASCAPPDPTFISGWPAVSFDNPSYGTTARARVLNSTAIACTPPAVVVEGLAALAVSFDNVTFSQPWSVAPEQVTPACKAGLPPGCAGNPCVEYFALFSAAVSRRPYLSGEAEGAIIVSTDASLAGVEGLTVSAALQLSPAVFLFSKTPIEGGSKVRVPFRLDQLPHTVRCNVLITLHMTLPTGRHDIVKQRWFERIPPALSAEAVHAAGTTSAVDHETGALLVDGQPYLMTGMYVSTTAGLGITHSEPSGILYLNNTQPHTASFTAQLERLARGGVSTLMIYSVLSFPPQQLEMLLDSLEAVGIRVVLMVVSEITPLAYANSTTAWDAFTGLVNRYKTHRALLGWYVRQRHV